MFDQQQIHIYGQSLSKDLVVLYDEITQFNDCCALMCDAFSALVGRDEVINPNTARGIDHGAIWIKKKVEEYKTIIGILLEQACALDNQIKPEPKKNPD